MFPDTKMKHPAIVRVMQMPHVSLVFLYLCCLLLGPCGSQFTDVTSTVIKPEEQGLLAAFGDFNSDKLIDLIFISSNNRTVFVLLKSKNTKDDISLSAESKLQVTVEESLIVTNVYPGDFNADSKMDLLLFCKFSNNDTNTLRLYYGYFNHIQEETQLTEEFANSHKDQLTPFDWNGDMKIDFVSEDKSKDGRFVWVSHSDSKGAKFTREAFPASELAGSSPLRKPSSNGFVDVSGDGVSDLLLVAEKEEHLLFEKWINRNGKYSLNSDKPVYHFNQGKRFGISLFIDIDSDGRVDHLLPVCLDEDCKESYIYYYSYISKEWHVAAKPATFTNSDSKQFGFYYNQETDHILSASMNIRAGDFNLDGFPDLLCILQDKGDDNDKMAFVLLENVKCTTDVCNGSRSFDVKWGLSKPFFDIDRPLVGAFYDLREDGILDVIISQMKDGKFVTSLYLNTLSEDASFVKVLVTSGLCDYICGGNTAYGSSQPGPMIYFETLRYDGSPQYGCAGQLVQASYFALQLPYITFGLGPTPNFVTKLVVSLPVSEKVISRKHTWEQIIPNSQLVAIPYPIDEPRSWRQKLFATPSRSVYATAGSLVGTCVFLALVIGILHWREKRADRKEKLVEAQRFHFNAM